MPIVIPLSRGTLGGFGFAQTATTIRTMDVAGATDRGGVGFPNRLEAAGELIAAIQQLSLARSLADVHLWSGRRPGA